jgi:hypothetical protein
MQETSRVLESTSPQEFGSCGAPNDTKLILLILLVCRDIDANNDHVASHYFCCVAAVLDV